MNTKSNKYDEEGGISLGPHMKKNPNGQVTIVLHNEYSSQQPLKRINSQVVKKNVEVNQPPSLSEIQMELDSLIGLTHIKEMVLDIFALISIQQKRKEVNLKSEQHSLHMLFQGNPGTGKTTVARLIGEYFKRIQLLPKGHVIEAERADLVGEYIGHTAQKTRDLIHKALGGILFIDEAYSLARGGDKDFGKEAIDTLVKHMEDKKDQFVLILAGYPAEMENFLTMNPGLRSRFPFVFDFPDYTDKELFQIAEQLIEEKEYTFSYEAKRLLKNHLTLIINNQLNNSSKPFANGRTVRNVIEKAIRNHARRLLDQTRIDRMELMTIRSQDIRFINSLEEESNKNSEKAPFQ
jgi:stage V sporulation protein K